MPEYPVTGSIPESSALQVSIPGVRITDLLDDSHRTCIVTVIVFKIFCFIFLSYEIITHL